jgi:hypothetical protein
MDAVGVRFGAIGERVPQIGELGVAVLFHQPGDVVATAPAAQWALDRKGRDAEIRQRVGVFSHGVETPGSGTSNLSSADYIPSHADN